jgi:hypothetical protein
MWLTVLAVLTGVVLVATGIFSLAAIALGDLLDGR